MAMFYSLTKVCFLNVNANSLNGTFKMCTFTVYKFYLQKITTNKY